MTLNNDQFRMFYRPPSFDRPHTIRAYNPSSKAFVGQMTWGDEAGGYEDSDALRHIDVAEEHQRKGVATSMWRFAQQMGQKSGRVPAPSHSTERTPEGDAWARSTGDYVPPNDMEDR